MPHKKTDDDTQRFNLKGDGGVKTDWKTLATIGTFLIGGTLFYAAVQNRFDKSDQQFNWLRAALERKASLDDIEKNNLRWKIANPGLVLPAGPGQSSAIYQYTNAQQAGISPEAYIQKGAE